MAIRKYIGDRLTLLSGDTKPTNMADGAILLETDTDIWYQLTSGAWVQIIDPQITQNASDIGDNTTDIGTNATNIGTNVTDIGDNATDIGTNVTNIGLNQDDILTNKNDLTDHENDLANPHQVTKTQVGLSNVDNTSDADKPVSTAQQTALDLKINTTEIGVSVEAFDATILKDADIGVTVEAFDATILKDADIGVSVEAFDATILKDSDIGVNVEAYNANIQAHIADVTTNPHAVTKTQVGLSNVDNIQQLPLSYLDTDGTLAANSDTKVTSQKAIKTYVDALVNAAVILQGDWNADTNTPDITSTTTTGHSWRVSVDGTTDLGGITDWFVGDLAVKTATGWLKIDNQDVAAVWGNISGTLSNQTDLQSALDLKADDSDLTAHENDTANPHVVTKTQVGLSNVDNTSDADKPVSTATQTALDLKADDSALTAHENDTANPHSVTLEQARTALNQLNGNIDFNDNDIVDLKTLGFKDGEELTWNDDFKTLNIPTGLGPVLQIGQEFWFLLYNDTGQTIPNGSVILPTGGTVVGSIVVPTVILAKGDNFETSEGTLMITSNEALDGELMMGTRIGRVAFDTSGFAPGVSLWLSADVAGEITDVRPSFPNYDLRIGGAINSDVNGSMGINFTKSVDDTFTHSWDGAIRESYIFSTSSDGAVITGALERDGTGDLTMIFSDGWEILDCTPVCTVVLTAGTDIVPVTNYVYIPQSTKVLTVSTSGWPDGTEHIRLANILLQSAATTQVEGALVNRNWNDHVKTTDNNGHLLHISERMRQNHAAWFSGAVGSAIVTSPTDSDVFVSATAGEVYQIHKQDFPALNTQTGDDVIMINHPTTSNLAVSNLNGQTLDANGVSMIGQRGWFVLWGVANKTGEISHLMINLPKESYSLASSAAEFDRQNHSVYDIPEAYKGNGFLIGNFLFAITNGGDDWELQYSRDLRGFLPNSTATGGGSGGIEPIESTSVTLDLSNYLGNYVSMASANTGTVYTTISEQLGGFAIVLINAASEPTVTGATKINGSTFEISTDMHMVVQNFGAAVQYFFIAL